MFSWVVRRSIERTSHPQQVYPQLVDQAVRVWMPAIALCAGSFVTPARAKMDVRTYEWAPSPAGWMANIPVTPPTVAQRWPAIESGINRQGVTPDRARLDVRRYDWSTVATNIPATVDATTRLRTGVFASELASYRTTDRAKLDVRSYDWAPQPAWIFKNLPAAGPSTAQQWPAFESALHSYRTADKAPGLDVRGQQWAPDFGYTDADTTAVWTPIDNAVSGRTADRPSFDVRRYEWAPVTAWIFTNLPAAVTQAQLWPAISEGTQNNYRTTARPSLDVRSYEWSPQFVSPVGQLAPVIASWGPAFSTELGSYRTGDRARLDLRAYDWSPEPAWIFSSLPPTVTVAQTWPAILEGTQPNYQTAARGRLDVRAYEWRSDPPWTPIVASTVRTWAGIFDGELASTRTGDRARLDVRAQDWTPEPAWIFKNLPAPTTTAQLWPAIEANLGRQYQTPRRARLDVRAYDWAPEFISPVRQVDLVVAKWGPVFAQELASFRSTGRQLLEVRLYDWSPELGWLFPNIPIPPPAAFGFGHRDGSGLDHGAGHSRDGSDIDQGAGHSRTGPITRATGGRSG